MGVKVVYGEPGMDVPQPGIVLDLPVPPSTNAYWRMGKNRIFRTEAANTYKEVVKAIARKQCKSPDWPTTAKVSLMMEWYRAKAWGDLDNRLKVALDALAGVVYLNDSQIRQIHAYMFDSEKENPRVIVTVTLLREGL